MKLTSSNVLSQIDGFLCASKAEAVRAIVETNLSRGYGNGNAARRRAQSIEDQYAPGYEQMADDKERCQGCGCALTDEESCFCGTCHAENVSEETAC
jgi:hypothetical protein